MSSYDKIMYCLISFSMALVGVTIGASAGEERGAKMHYKGEMVCETLLDNTVRCIPASQVKEK